jgi:hypothetical protein
MVAHDMGRGTAEAMASGDQRRRRAQSFVDGNMLAGSIYRRRKLFWRKEDRRTAREAMLPRDPTVLRAGQTRQGTRAAVGRWRGRKRGCILTRLSDRGFFIIFIFSDGKAYKGDVGLL